MENGVGPVDGRPGHHNRVGCSNFDCCGIADKLGKVLEENHFVLVFRLSVRIIFVLVLLVGKPFAELAFAVTVDYRLISIDTKVLRNKILVGVKVDDNDCLAEGRSQGGDQQK